MINHLIVLYNVFGETATPLIFFKLEESLWNTTKSFLMFLNKLPAYPKTQLHHVHPDINALSILQKSIMERQKIDKIIDAFRSAMYQEFSVSEDVPTNAATGGGVAGLPPDDPPVKLDGRRKYVKKYLDQLMKKRKKREE